MTSRFQLIERADDTILTDIERFALHPKVVKRAIEIALEELRPSNGQAERERARLQNDLRRVQTELGNLTRALAAGGELASLVAAVQAGEQQRQALESQLALPQHLTCLWGFLPQRGASVGQLLEDLAFKVLRGAGCERSRVTTTAVLAAEGGVSHASFVSGL